jgi:hypothetical protein
MDSNSKPIAAAIEMLTAQCYEDNKRWWGIEEFSNPLIVPTKLALIHSEISEALEGHRKSEWDAHLPKFLSIEVELADALIRIFDLAGAQGYDLAGALIAKRAYNAKRVDHTHEARAKSNGKKY